MDLEAEHKIETWPPGTVRIETLQREACKGIILQPPPSDDPNDPLNWPRWRKNLNFGLASFYAMMVFAFIDAATPTWGPMNEQLGFSYEILNDSYAVGCGTLAMGAFLLIPFALKYGRRPVYIISTAAQLAFSVWSARIQTVADLMLVNAFSCLTGALAEVIVQMTVADVFFVHQRGAMNTVYVWFLNSGSYLSPVAAGYITQSQGWRWVWWWMAIFFGACLVAFTFLYEETKYSDQAVLGVAPEKNQDPLSAGKRSQSITKDFKHPKTDISTSTPTHTDLEASPSRTINHPNTPHIDPTIPRKTYLQRLPLTTSSPGKLSHFARHSYQPLQILFTIPAVTFMSLVYGCMLAWSTILTTTLSSFMTLPPYSFTSAQIGLMSVAPFIGQSLGALICGPVSDRLILLLAARNRGVYEPEMRLWVMVPFIPFVPAGAFMFGFGLNDGRAWPVLAVGYAISSFGAAPISSIALTYITDSYTEIVADSLVAVTFTRNLLATVFVFALTPWINRVGIKNVFVTIGVLGTVILLFTFVFIAYGKRCRVWTAGRYRGFAAKQFEARRV